MRGRGLGRRVAAASIGGKDDQHQTASKHLSRHVKLRSGIGATKNTSPARGSVLAFSIVTSTAPPSPGRAAFCPPSSHHTLLSNGPTENRQDMDFFLNRPQCGTLMVREDRRVVELIKFVESLYQEPIPKC